MIWVVRVAQCFLTADGELTDNPDEAYRIEDPDHARVLAEVTLNARVELWDFSTPWLS